MSGKTRFHAVIFDIGGVVLGSPFVGIARYEREHGIPENYLNCSIVAHGSKGAWQRFERGELDLFEFYDIWSQELSDTKLGNPAYQDYCSKKGVVCPDLPTEIHVNGRDLFGHMMKEANAYDPHMRKAIDRLRAHRVYKIIALTNNFSGVLQGKEIPQSELEFLGWQDGPVPQHLRDLFDDFCDSSILGKRKPEPEFYLLACERNGIHPKEAVFLDDIKVNLRTAKELGMHTIHVALGDTLGAVKELEALLELDLTGPIAPVSISRL